MKIFSLQNLTSHVIAITDDTTLSTVVNPRPSGMDKKTYGEWCRLSTTNGHFISAWEGLNPQGRICAQNPGRLLHGIIADYDNPNALAELNDLPTTTSHLPMWVVESFSPGKCRLIWAFENPVICSNPDLTEAFIKVLNEKIKVSEALPGFDKSSWKDTQYFELGTNWQSVTGAFPIPDALLSQCMFEAGTRSKLESSDVEIPLDVVAAEVEARFPGRWPASQFVEGAVGPLFWVEPFVNHRSCAVTLNGMVCFSDRAASNFMPWRAIFGNKFVEKFEQEKAARLAEMFYYDGEKYWGEVNGSWEHHRREDAQLHIKDAGGNPNKKKGKNLSEVESVLCYIQKQRRVHSAAPILFESQQVVDVYSRRILNTSKKKVMQPAETGDPKDFPWLYDFIMNSFNGDQNGVPAHEYFIAWFKRFYQTSYEQNPQQGQSIVIAGGAHSGKSLFVNWVIGRAMGGACDASDILLGKTRFNMEAAHNSVWLCDDAVNNADMNTRQELAMRLKAMAAKPTVRYEPKFQNSSELPFKGRVIVCCNTDPESLRILPTMDGTIQDKIMLFRFNYNYHAHFFDNNSENEGRILRELPFFLRWLLNYQVDPRVIDTKHARFGVISFHHQALVEEATSEQPETRLAEVIRKLMAIEKGNYKAGDLMKVDVSELSLALNGAGLGDQIRQLGGLNRLGKLLNKVFQQKLSPYITQPPKKVKGYNTYIFDPHAQEPE
jgi:hypothetical protein